MALNDTLLDRLKPKKSGQKLGLVARSKPPKLEGGVFEKNQAIRQYLSQLSAEIQTNKQNGFATTIPNETISWLQTNSTLSDLQLKSPDLNLYNIGEEIKRLDQILVVQKGELQSSQYQIPQDLKKQFQNSISKQLDLQRDINKTLPLLRKALAGATGTTKQRELSFLVLSNNHYNNVLKKLLTKELESGVPLTTAISNTLQKARGNPAIATIIAMANANTQKNIKDLTVDDLLNIDQKTAELVTQKVKDSAPQDLKPDEIPQKAKRALEIRFQTGSKQNLEKILIASGKTQQEAILIINQINTQASLGLSPKEIAVLVSTQHQLLGSKDFVSLTQNYADNVQYALANTTGVHPTNAQLALQNTGKQEFFQQVILGTNQQGPSSPITSYLGAVGVQPQFFSTNTSTPPTLTQSYQTSASFLFNVGDANVRYFFTDPESPPPTSGDFNFEKQTQTEGGGLGEYIMQVGGEMVMDAAGDKLKEEFALWVAKAGALASGVGAPFVAAYEAARNMPVIGGVIKDLEKNVLKQGWETTKKAAVLGGALVGGALVGIGMLIGKGVGFLTSVGGGAFTGFVVGNAIFPGLGGIVGGGIGGITGGLTNLFWPQISGAANSAVSGLGSMLSSAGSGLANFGSSLFNGLASLGSSAIQGIGWIVSASIAGVAGISLLAAATATSTFLVDIAPFGASEYLTLTKTASHTPSVLENNTGSVDITYTITFKPKNNSQITSVDQVADTFTFVSDSQNLPPLTSPLTPQSFTRNNAGDYVATYNVTINTNSYPDTAIVNTIAAAVTLTTEDNQTVTDSVSANRRVIVGDPPIEFPYCWPTSGVITQAPNTGHLTLNDSGEAVDIGQSDRNMVYASHDGTIFRDNWGCGYGGVNGGYGNCFAVVSPAGYSTIYGHLSWQNPEFVSGSQVKMGDPLGMVGSTGNSTGPHLHYELVGIDFADLNIGSTGEGTVVVESCSGQN